MNAVVRELITKIAGAENLEAAKAYAEAALLVDADLSKVTPRLTKFGDSKIEAIKIIRNKFGYGLKEAKDAVETMGTTFPAMSVFEAGRFKSELAGCGFTLEF